MQELDWENNVDNKEQKLELAKRIAKRVKNGDVIGFGSGTTSYLAVKEISKRIKEENLNIKAVTTSNIIEDLCKSLDIQTTNLDEVKLDWCFDGADEVQSNNDWLLKGMGGAFYKEKLNIKSSNENYILVDDTKIVEKLGSKHPVPIECNKDKIEYIKKELKNIGAKDINLRMLKNEKEPFITDNGNVILHAWFDNIEKDLEERINNIDGVVDNGLFIGYNVIIEKSLIN